MSFPLLFSANIHRTMLTRNETDGWLAVIQNTTHVEGGPHAVSGLERTVLAEKIIINVNPGATWRIRLKHVLS